MNESYQPRPIRPDSIIDLRPKTSRRSVSWRDLTAIRIIIFLVHLVWDVAVLIFGFIYKILRSLGLAFINLFFGFKKISTDLKKTKTELTKLTKLTKEEIKQETVSLIAPATKRSSPVFRLLNFILLLCLIILPFVLYSSWRALTPLKEAILQKTNSAVLSLFSAKDLIQEQNLAGAQISFVEASNNFLKAQASLKQINQGLLNLAGILPGEQFRLASESQHLLNAGTLAARLGADLTSAAAVTGQTKVTAWLDHFISVATPATDEASSLVDELNKIKVTNLPEQYRQQFLDLRQQAILLAPSLKEAVGLAQELSIFLGKQYDKRYLLVFQNNSEKRASGGFIGSFATFDVSQGNIKNITVPKGGSYDTEAGLYKRILAPEPLWLVNTLWHFWDANWWPDWPKSAQKLAWFYEKSNGPTVDGVISLTPTVIERLLQIHGPIDMTKDYGVIITADNFWTVTQTFSEQKPSVTKEPKKIIGDLMTKLMEDLPKNMNTDKALAMMAMLEKSLDEKQILFYFNDPSLEKTVNNFGWDGGIKNTDYDYLMVTTTNIGGQKSDRAIKETINHNSEILLDGSIIDTLTIERAHTAFKNQPFVGFRNVSWVRVYVPEGSELISASGFNQPDPIFFKAPAKNLELDPDLANERAATIDPNSSTKIYTENNKTVFANWSMVDPGNTAVIKLTYRLPFVVKPTAEPKNIIDKIRNYFQVRGTPHYSLLVQKQAGEIGTIINSNLQLANNWQILWKYPEGLKINDTGWSISQPLDTDMFITTLYNYKK
jgi:hypothetical protein